jgi:hypothetical protein
MMLIPSLVMILAGPAAFAAGPPFSDFCVPFVASDCEIVWKAETAALPASVKVYQVTPREFGPPVVSNLLALVELKASDRKQPPTQGVFRQRGVLAFGTRDDMRNATVVPSQGFLSAVNYQAVAGPRESPTAVPGDGEAVERARALVPLLGLDARELMSSKSNALPAVEFSESAVMKRDKTTRIVSTNIVRRGVSLRRQIDGIPVWGPAGFSVKFGNNSRVASLEAVWRNVRATKEQRVPSAPEFIRAMKAGKTFIRSQEPPSFRKLTVTNVHLYYWESEGSVDQKWVYPFATLEASGDNGSGSTSVLILAPIE